MLVLSQVLSDNIIKGLEDGVLKSWLESVLPSVFGFFWSVVLALLVAYIGGKVIKSLRKIFRKSLERRDAEEGVKQFADQVFKVFLWIVVVIIILGLFGVTASSLAAAVASLGVTAGLALQGSLSNFAGGMLILMLHPFRVGDYIIEDTNKNEGTVFEISIFYTKLRTVDNKIVVIPNGTLANSSLTNATKSNRRQLDLVVPISYDADIKKAKELLMELSQKETRRLTEEGVKVFVKELNGSSVDLGLRFWVPTEEYWNVRWDMLENIKLTFDAEGIGIPYTQLDVHMKE
ncbi:MAG: mechanosensitive ion channel [Lachnospiraceae bacterium]|nr:mechanosensitive ion channel [Lachnospiraceae bacterium]